MIGLETHVLLRHYLEQGLSKKAIAEKLGITDRTIRRWIRQGELERPFHELPRYKTRPRRAHKLDPFIEIIRARLEAYPELSSRRILEEIQAAGYTGGYTQLTLLVSELRPRQAPEGPPVRFETPAGHQGQVDFAEFRFPWGKRYALVVVLGYSRLLWIRFFKRQDMRSLFAGLEEAFAYLGGVPKELLFDQMKAVITQDLRLKGKQLVVNEEFLRFAAHWGFRPRACRPYRAQTKGKVERPIRYVRGNLVYGREFLNDAHLAEEASRWLEKANGRIHATTKEVPRMRFERDERAVLTPLVARPYQSFVLAEEREPLMYPTLPVRIALPEVASHDPRPGIALPRVPVEKRPLTAYAALVGGVL